MVADSQFPNREKDLPVALTNLCDELFVIKWCEDLRAYKKLIPALNEYPDDIIVTVDDDTYYQRSWLKRLYVSYCENPNCIIAHRVTRFTIDDAKLVPVDHGIRFFYHHPNFLNKLTGIGGVLYPPHCLHSDATNKELFQSLAPTNDDQWFWFMGILNNYRVKICDYPIPSPDTIPGTQEVGLTNINDHGQLLFWKDLNRLLEYYPQALTALQKDYAEFSKEYLGQKKYQKLLKRQIRLASEWWGEKAKKTYIELYGGSSRT